MSLNEDQYNLSPQQFVIRFVVVASIASFKNKIREKNYYEHFCYCFVISSFSSDVVISIRIQQAFEMNLKITLVKLLFFFLHLEFVWLGNEKVEGLRWRWKSWRIEEILVFSHDIFLGWKRKEK